MARKSDKNLIPQAHVLTVEEQSAGGKASVEARRRKKLFKEILEEQLNSEGGTLNGQPATRKELAAYNMVKLITSGKAKDSDFIKAMEYVRDTIGEKPTEKVEVSKATSETVKEMEEFFSSERTTEKDT